MSAPTVTCSLCNEQNHRASRCPHLHDALNDGFFTGGGSGGGSHSHSDDEDDEKAALSLGIYPINGISSIPLLRWQNQAYKMLLTSV
jgi:hypothetical protein